MKNHSGIVYLSFPFAAGVAAAALAARPFGCALCSSAAVIVLFFLCIHQSGRSELCMTLLFFFTGVLCWSSSYLCPPPPSVRNGYSGAIAGILDRIPFEGEHSGPIIKALLTGDRSGLPKATVASFRRSGASHILALSGLHLGVIYVFIGNILSLLGNSRAARLLRGTLSITLCGIYTAATGASASTVRAFLFILINETGRSLSGRARSPLGTFCTALTVQLAWKPALIASAGFQLSYLAMLGITLLYPVLEPWYPGSSRKDPLRAIWKSAAMSVSCQLFTAPAAWIHFHSFPPYFLITNLITLPLTELVIVLAAIAAVLEFAGICPQALAFACGKLVQTLEFCLETIASLPY